MLSSPRRPDSTIRIFSSAEYCLRVRRRIFRTTCSAGSLAPMDFCLISVPFGHYDEPEILRYENTSACPIGADVRHSTPIQTRSHRSSSVPTTLASASSAGFDAEPAEPGFWRFVCYGNSMTPTAKLDGIRGPVSTPMSSALEHLPVDPENLPDEFWTSGPRHAALGGDSEISGKFPGRLDPLAGAVGAVVGMDQTENEFGAFRQVQLRQRFEVGVIARSMGTGMWIQVICRPTHPASRFAMLASLPASSGSMKCLPSQSP